MHTVPGVPYTSSPVPRFNSPYQSQQLVSTPSPMAMNGINITANPMSTHATAYDPRRPISLHIPLGDPSCHPPRKKSFYLLLTLLVVGVLVMVVTVVTAAVILSKYSDKMDMGRKQSTGRSSSVNNIKDMMSTPSETACQRVTCSKPLVCIINHLGLPYCDCPSNCTSSASPSVALITNGPVCSSDGVTYESECHLLRTKCHMHHKLTQHSASLHLRHKPQEIITYSSSSSSSLSTSYPSPSTSFDSLSINPLTLSFTPGPCPGSSGDSHYVSSSGSGSGSGSESKSPSSSSSSLSSNTIRTLGETSSTSTSTALSPTSGCTNVSCPYHGICHQDINGITSCRCPPECGPHHRPVCGSDATTYQNVCFLHKRSCESQKEIKQLHPGHCRTCDDLQCAHYSNCEVTHSGLECRCPNFCPVSTSFQPVCGSDGKTYDSECDLQMRSCEAQTPITIRHVGDCDVCKKITCHFGSECNNGKCICPTQCPTNDLIEPVCVDLMFPFKSECEMRVSACEQELDFSDSFILGPCPSTSTPPSPDSAIINNHDFGADAHHPINNNDIDFDQEEEDEDEEETEEEEEEDDDDGEEEYNEEERDEEDIEGKMRKKEETRLCHRLNCPLGSTCKVTSSPLTTSLSVSSFQNDILDENSNRLFPTHRMKAQCDCTHMCDKTIEHQLMTGTSSGPVCGSDSRVYENECSLRQDSCLEGTNLQVMEDFSLCSLSISRGEGGIGGGAGGGGNIPSYHLHHHLRHPHNHHSIEGSGEESSQESFIQVTEHNELGMKCRCNKYGSFNPDCDIDVGSSTSSSDLEPGTSSGFIAESSGPTEPGMKSTSQSIPTSSSLPPPQSSSLTPDISSNLRTGESVTLQSDQDEVKEQCRCRPGVGGLSCDRCQPDYWGLHQILSEGHEGCRPCLCDPLGSVRSDCEQMTGRCVCKPGVKGTKCDECPLGRVLTQHGCTDESIALPVAKPCSMMICLFGATCEEKDRTAQCSCDALCDPTAPSSTILFPSPFTSPLGTSNYRTSVSPPVSASGAGSSFNPVCGSDGMTYANECQLKLHSCRIQESIVAISLGPCRNPLFSMY